MFPPCSSESQYFHQDTTEYWNTFTLVQTIVTDSIINHIDLRCGSADSLKGTKKHRNCKYLGPTKIFFPPQNPRPLHCALYFFPSLSKPNQSFKRKYLSRINLYATQCIFFCNWEFCSPFLPYGLILSGKNIVLISLWLQTEVKHWIEI